MKNIFVIGDIVLGVVLVYKVSYEVKIVVEVIFGKKVVVDYKVMLVVVFIDLELVSVGMIVVEVKEVGIEVKGYKFLFVGNGCVIFLDKIEGFMCLVIIVEDNVIIGV